MGPKQKDGMAVSEIFSKGLGLRRPSGATVVPRRGSLPGFDHGDVAPWRGSALHRCLAGLTRHERKP